MTVIAYKAGILASDSQVQAGNSISGTARKVFKNKKGWLVGGAGNLSDINEFLYWAEDMNWEEPPEAENLGALLVDPKGKVFAMSQDYKPFLIKAPFQAEGSGAEMALGAMAFGASAEEAVRIVVKHNISCGGAVQKVQLDAYKGK